MDVEETSWHQGDEKENEPITHQDYLEAIRSNPITKRIPYDDPRANQALKFIRRRWRRGYEVLICDDGTVGLQNGWSSGIGHIVNCDSNHITVHWRPYRDNNNTEANYVKRFRRSDERVQPRDMHIQNVIKNGKNQCVKYEFDEEKVDNSDHVITKVWFD